MRDYLTTEIRYRLFPFVVATVLYLMFFFVAVALDKWDLNQFFTNSAIAFWVSTGIMRSKANKERRDRLYTLLPLPLTHLSRVRVLDVLLSKAYLLLYWIVFLLVRPAGFAIDKFWYMLSFSALAVSIVLGLKIHHDLGYFNHRKPRYVLYTLFVVFLAVLIWGGTNQEFQDYAARYHDQLTNNPYAFAVWAVVLLALTRLSMVVFARRASYVA